MARIPTYQSDTYISDLDRIIGTDGDSPELTTKNFFLGDIASFVIDKFIEPDGSDYYIPVFRAEGTRITNSIISQDIAPLGGAITVAGNATINKDFAVLGKSNLVGDVVCSNNLDIGNELDVAGSTTLRSSLVAENAEFKQQVIMRDKLDVYGKTNIYSPLIVHEQLTVRGAAEFQDRVTIEDQLLVTDAATFNDVVAFNDEIRVEGKIIGKDEISIDGVGFFGGTVSVEGELNVLEAISLQNGDMTLNNGGQIKKVNDPTAQQDVVTLNYLRDYTKFGNFIVLNGLVNNIASQGSGYDFMEWTSNVTGPTQIPIFKTGNDLRLISVTWAFMGGQALSIQPGESIDFGIGVVKQGVSSDITNYTEDKKLFSITDVDNGTFPHGIVKFDEEKVLWYRGEHLAVVGTEAGAITPIDGELALSFTFEIIEIQQ